MIDHDIKQAAKRYRKRQDFGEGLRDGLTLLIAMLFVIVVSCLKFF